MALFSSKWLSVVDEHMQIARWWQRRSITRRMVCLYNADISLQRWKEIVRTYWQNKRKFPVSYPPVSATHCTADFEWECFTRRKTRLLRRGLRDTRQHFNNTCCRDIIKINATNSSLTYISHCFSLQELQKRLRVLCFFYLQRSQSYKITYILNVFSFKYILFISLLSLGYHLQLTHSLPAI